MRHHFKFAFFNTTENNLHFVDPFLILVITLYNSYNGYNSYNTVVLVQNKFSTNYLFFSFIYFHVDENIREKLHKYFLNSLKLSGKLIYLVYEKDHLKLNTNGPSSINLLYSLDNFAEDFIDMEIEFFKKENITRVKNGIIQEQIVIKFIGSKV